MYYAGHLTNIHQVFDKLVSSNAVEKCHQFLKDLSVKSNFIHIQSNYEVLSVIIRRLELSELLLSKVISIINK